MIDRTKLSKNITLVTESLWSAGNRIFTGRLRPPKKTLYDNEEECIRFEGSTLYINKNVLSKYGIEIKVTE